MHCAGGAGEESKLVGEGNFTLGKGHCKAHQSVVHSNGTVLDASQSDCSQVLPSVWCAAGCLPSSLWRLRRRDASRAGHPCGPRTPPRTPLPPTHLARLPRHPPHPLPVHPPCAPAPPPSPRPASSPPPASHAHAAGWAWGPPPGRRAREVGRMGALREGSTRVFCYWRPSEPAQGSSSHALTQLGKVPRPAATHRNPNQPYSPVRLTTRGATCDTDTYHLHSPYRTPHTPQTHPTQPTRPPPPFLTVRSAHPRNSATWYPTRSSPLPSPPPCQGGSTSTWLTRRRQEAG